MNNFWFTLKIALSSLNGNRLRSFLTMLGIIIGIASVIAIVSLGAGAQSLISNALKNLGTSTLIVLPGNANDSGPPASALGIIVVTLTDDDAEALTTLPGVVSVTGNKDGSAEMVYLKRFTNGNYSGVNYTYPSLESHNASSGRFFTEQEDSSGKQVVVLGQNVKDKLFPLSDPLGEKMKIQGQAFTVIGVLESKGSTFFDNPDNRVYVPLKVAQNLLSGEDHLSSIRVLVEDESLVPIVKVSVQQLLRYRHEIEGAENDDFSVRSVQQALDIFNGITNALKFFLASIAAVSLIIGGISITNIMLMTVKERTREIGLRKALGAKPAQIQSQFLLESVVLTVVGGFIGVLVGALLSLFVAVVMQSLDYDWSFELSLSAISIAFFTSAFIGITFGYFPAKRAASLDPIKALRYE
jgi:putative ABC transport system permease protein